MYILSIHTENPDNTRFAHGTAKLRQAHAMQQIPYNVMLFIELATMSMALRISCTQQRVVEDVKTSFMAIIYRISWPELPLNPLIHSAILYNIELHVDLPYILKAL